MVRAALVFSPSLRGPLHHHPIHIPAVADRSFVMRIFEWVTSLAGVGVAGAVFVYRGVVYVRRERRRWRGIVADFPELGRPRASVAPTEAPHP